MLDSYNFCPQSTFCHQRCPLPNATEPLAAISCIDSVRVTAIDDHSDKLIARPLCCVSTRAVSDGSKSVSWCRKWCWCMKRPPR